MPVSQLSRISVVVACFLLAGSWQALAQDADTGVDNSSATNNPPASPPAQSAPPPQQRPATPAGGTRINLQVGGELYGNHNAVGPLYGPQVQPLPSETRLAIQRSGALPSEILINSQAVGPLSPHGAIDYVPDQSPVQKAMGAKPLNLWGPAYGPSQPAPTGPVSPMLQNGTLPASSANAFNQTNIGTVNRSLGTAGNVPAASPLYVNRYIQPQSLSAGYLVTPSPYRTGVTNQTTTITIPIHRIASTQPTTQSLGDEH